MRTARFRWRTRSRGVGGVSGLARVAMVAMLGAMASPPTHGAEKDPEWDSTEPEAWPEGFERVEIRSSHDGTMQSAYARAAAGSEPAPLVVSLHTWSGDFSQRDPLAPLLAARGFHYIHPDFRGRNRRPEACASPAARRDIDDAIDICLERWSVDRERVFVVGTSGGGHATCVTYCASKHRIAGFFAWASIIDLGEWYWQTKQRGLKYAGEIERVLGGGFDLDAARERSPLFLALPPEQGKLHLFAGINDGYEGSVPIDHSLRFFNRLCEARGAPERRLSAEAMRALLSKATPPGEARIGGRAIYLRRDTPFVELTVFEGGHEMLVEACAERIVAAAGIGEEGD